jgi:hypothetical protein
MMARYVFDRRLPRAPLFGICRSHGRPMWSTFGHGNHWNLYVWRLNIG